MTVKQRDFLVLNFLQGIIEFNPFVHLMRIEVMKFEKIFVFIFYDEWNAERLHWIAEYLILNNEPAKLICLDDQGEKINIVVSLTVHKFPINSFAKEFDIKQILGKKVKTMDLNVNSPVEMEKRDENYDFWIQEAGPDCNLIIGSINPENQRIIKEEIVTVPAVINTSLLV